MIESLGVNGGGSDGKCTRSCWTGSITTFRANRNTRERLDGTLLTIDSRAWFYDHRSHRRPTSQRRDTAWAMFDFHRVDGGGGPVAGVVLDFHRTHRRSGTITGVVLHIHRVNSRKGTNAQVVRSLHRTKQTGRQVDRTRQGRSVPTLAHKRTIVNFRGLRHIPLRRFRGSNQTGRSTPDARGRTSHGRNSWFLFALAPVEERAGTQASLPFEALVLCEPVLSTAPCCCNLDLVPVQRCRSSRWRAQ